MAVNRSKATDPRFKQRWTCAGALGVAPGQMPEGAIIINDKEGTSGSFRVKGVTINAKFSWRDDNAPPEEEAYLFFPGVLAEWSASRNKAIRLCARFGPLVQKGGDAIESVIELCVHIGAESGHKLGIGAPLFDFDLTKPFWAVIEVDKRKWMWV